MARRVLPLIILLPAIHLLLRIVFWYHNRGLFPRVWPQETTAVFLRGLQQDWASLVLVNFPVILILFWHAWTRPPATGGQSSATRRALLLAARLYFIAANSVALALNCIDTGYFRFVHHRASRDLDHVLAGSLSSFRNLLATYWPLLLLFIGLVFVLFKLSTLFGHARRVPRPLPLAAAQFFLLILLLLSLGLPGRPVIPATPLLSVSPTALPLAQNSALTYLYSTLHRADELKPVRYFTHAALDSIVTTSHQLRRAARGFQKKNVVLFILESFSRSYVIPGDPQKANTPFFDSLIRKSLFFPYSFANGATSNQGIVSILGGLPALMDEPFYYSQYANTPLRSLGNILKDSGYSTNFFMGAPRDHFGFGKFARMAGIDEALWENDFNDERYYDGNWGIYDEPFLQYGARVLSRTPQPFFGTFFTITMHDPFTIPQKYRQTFAYPDKTPAMRVVSYSDLAFREFFATSEKMPWFRNTLFVFCADHWLDPADGSGAAISPAKAFTIPIFIYDPETDTGVQRTTVAGQVDIAPTILDLLGYSGAYTGFGRSLLDTTIADSDRYVINKYGANYQVITSDYIYGYDPDTDQGTYLYRYTTDSACRSDLLDTPAAGLVRQKLERLVKANIQAYRQALTARNLFAF